MKGKRSISVLLVLCMLLSVVPMFGITASAESTEITYLYPEYNETNGDFYTNASSGIKRWLEGKITSYQTIANTTTAWGENVNEESWYVVTGQVAIDGMVTVTGKVNLILADDAELTVTAKNSKEAGIKVSFNNTLNIFAQSTGEHIGKLTATGGPGGAGIGVDESGNKNGNITINGGVVTAAGGQSGAGIGSAYQTSAVNITINGGVVTATGQNSAAGIGSGLDCDCLYVTINGGTVMGTGGPGGAGIGSGGAGTAKNITINDGTVIADGGTNGGAGIGGGSQGHCSDITINGGTVTATGGADGGAGIGAGNGRFAKTSNISIYGGIVTAAGGSDASAIGGGKSAQTVSGIKVATKLAVKAGNNNPPTVLIQNDGGDLASALVGKQYAIVGVADYAYLDLESDSTYPDSKTIDQPYKLTQTGETTYIEKTKVKVEWVLPEISASFTQTKTWNPDTMKWDDSKVTSTIGEKQAKFTFTNYSSVKVGAQVSFAKAIGTDTNPSKSDVSVMDTMVNADAGRTLKSSASTIAIITHDYTPAASEFNALSAGSGTYGTYTLRLIYVYKVTFNMKGHGDAVDTQYIVSGEKVTAPTPEPSATNYIFGGWYKEEGCTTPWNFTDDTVTADTVLYAKWSSNTYTVTLVPGHGKENSSVIATNGQAMPTLQGDQIPYDTAYEFLGYFDQQEGGNRYYNADGTSAQNYNLTTDTTLYAQWKELGQPE